MKLFRVIFALWRRDALVLLSGFVQSGPNRYNPFF